MFKPGNEIPVNSHTGTSQPEYSEYTHRMNPDDDASTRQYEGTSGYGDPSEQNKGSLFGNTTASQGQSSYDNRNEQSTGQYGGRDDNYGTNTNNNNSYGNRDQSDLTGSSGNRDHSHPTNSSGNRDEFAPSSSYDNREHHNTYNSGTRGGGDIRGTERGEKQSFVSSVVGKTKDLIHEGSRKVSEHKHNRDVNRNNNSTYGNDRTYDNNTYNTDRTYDNDRNKDYHRNVNETNQSSTF